jgi:hypothetical protein
MTVLVNVDAITSGEKLCLRLCDSDRFSADDELGVVEVEFTTLVGELWVKSGKAPLVRRKDHLVADRPGLRAQGTLEWSVAFFPLWRIPPKEMDEKLVEMRKRHQPPPVYRPWWLDMLSAWMNSVKDVPKWEEDRAKRRKETLAWFTGEKERDEMEVEAKPSDDHHSGVLRVSFEERVSVLTHSISFTSIRARTWNWNR